MNALVRIEADRALADSRDVAAQFSKRHDNVLRSIDAMLKERPELRLNFEAQLFEIKQNGAMRRYRRFDMDRKGFMLLVMGFNGAKALEIKSRWIDAFDAMERSLALQALANDDDATADDPPPGSGAMIDYAPALCVIREARHVFGRAAAQRLWGKLGLPAVADHPAVSGVPELVFVPDAMRDWLAQCTRPCAAAKERASALYASYTAWCHDMRLQPDTHTRFGRVLEKLGYTKHHSGLVWRVGLELIT